VFVIGLALSAVGPGSLCGGGWSTEYDELAAGIVRVQ
jgi:hypothetical protein